jgi:WD40 repeat protein
MASADILMTVWGDSERALQLEAVDSVTGSATPGWSPIVLTDSGRDVAGYAFSADGRRMAVLSGTAPFCSPSAGGSACWSGADRLHLVDLIGRDEETLDIAETSHVSTLTFSPDGGTLALARATRSGFSISLWPGDGIAPPREASLPFLPSILAYSTNGNELIALGSHPGDDPGMSQPGPLTVAVLDSATLATLWEQTLDIRHGGWCLEGCGETHEQVLFANWSPAIVRLPGTDRIVIFHADGEKMTTIETALRRVQTADLTAARSWLDRWMALGTVAAEAKGGSEGVFRQAVASPDGRRVYLVGRAFDAWRDADGLIQMSDTPLGLQVIDPAGGTRLTALETDADHVSLSQDGSWVLLRSWTPSGARTEIVPAHALGQGRSVEDWDIHAGRGLDGGSILLATSLSPAVLRLAPFDPATLDIGQPWTLPGRATLLFP